MLRNRLREAGGVDTVFVPVADSAVKTIEIVIVWTWVRSSTKEPSFKMASTRDSGTIPGFGLPWGRIAPPPWARNSGGDYYLKSTPAFLEDLGGQFSSLLSADVVSAFSPGRIELATSSDRRSMADVVGSGFNKFKGRRFIVNPCTSSTEVVTAGTSQLGEPFTLSSVARTAGASTSHAEFRVLITYTQQATVGLTTSRFGELIAQCRDGLPSVHDQNAIFSDVIYDVEGATMELLISAAEINKTLGYIVGRLKSIGRILALVKRRDFSFLKRPRNGEVGDLWLEARYAIRPIVIDVDNAIKALAEGGKLEPILTKRKRTTEDFSSELYQAWTDAKGYSYVLTGGRMATQTVHAGVYASLQLNTGAAHTLGLFNLASVAWELIPWSFVAGWFVNVSALLAALNPNPTYQIKNGFVAVKNEIFFSGTLEVTHMSETTAIPISVQLTDYVRIPKLAPDLMPSINVNLSVPKLLDLLAFARKFK